MLSLGAFAAMIALVLLLNGFISLASHYIASLPRINHARPAETKIASIKSDKTIVIKGESSVMVGQMAKLPAPSAVSPEVSSMSKVDKDTGQELLSIVGKY